jgi:hypothetical protein
LYETALSRGRIRSTAIRALDGPERSTLRLGQIYMRLRQRARAEQLWRDFLKRHPEAVAVKAALEKSYLAPCSIIVDSRPRPRSPDTTDDHVVKSERDQPLDDR